MCKYMIISFFIIMGLQQVSQKIVGDKEEPLGSRTQQRRGGRT